MEQKMLCTEQHLPEVFSDLESVFMGQLREFIQKYGYYLPYLCFIDSFTKKLLGKLDAYRL